MPRDSIFKVLWREKKINRPQKIKRSNNLSSPPPKTMNDLRCTQRSEIPTSPVMMLCYAEDGIFHILYHRIVTCFCLMFNTAQKKVSLICWYNCSHIPRPQLSGKKMKARPAPDFSKLHKKWDEQLQNGLSCKKKPTTIVGYW